MRSYGAALLRGFWVPSRAHPRTARVRWPLTNYLVEPSPDNQLRIPNELKKVVNQPLATAVVELLLRIVANQNPHAPTWCKDMLAKRSQIFIENFVFRP